MAVTGLAGHRDLDAGDSTETLDPLDTDGPLKPHAFEKLVVGCEALNRLVACRSLRFAYGVPRPGDLLIFGADECRPRHPPKMRFWRLRDRCAIEVQRDGTIAYRVKTPRKGRTHRVMAPLEFMARLAALIPHPHIAQIRYHGVFASRSSWRPLVTPKPRPKAAEKGAVRGARGKVNAPVATECAQSATCESTPAPMALAWPGFMPPQEAAPFTPWVFEGSGAATPIYAAVDVPSHARRDLGGPGADPHHSQALGALAQR